MRVAVALSFLLAVVALAGCSQPTAEPATLHAETLYLKFANQSDAEFGDLLNEPITIDYWVVPDEGQGSSDSDSINPGEFIVVEVPLADFDGFTVRHYGTSPSGAGIGASSEYSAVNCADKATIHLDVRYYAKLTAGAWSWGVEWSDDC